MPRSGKIWSQEMDAKARKMRDEGVSWDATARALGVCTQTVRYHLVPEERARHLERQKVRRQARRLLRVRLSDTAWETLAVAAGKRRMHVGSLAGRILSTILLENMVNAVLDDGVQA